MSDPSPRAAVRSDARRTATTALLASLLAGSVLFTVPLHPVPITLQVFVVVLIALLVEPAWAALSVATYLLLGAVGLPVFAGFQGGIARLVGPTGGFLVGFLAAAVLGSWARRALERRGVAQLTADVAAAAVAIAAVYLLGWAWLAIVTGKGAAFAFAAGVAPFAALDAVKAAAAVAVAVPVRRAARI